MTLTIESDSLISVAKDAISCDLANAAVILNVTSGVYFGLDPVGADVWSYIQQPRCFAEIREYLMANYDVDQASCERSLRQLLEKMQEQSLIQVGQSAVAS